MYARDIIPRFERFLSIIIVLLLLKFSEVFFLQILHSDVNFISIILFLSATVTAIVVRNMKNIVTMSVFAIILLTYVTLDYSRSSHFSLLILIFLVYFFSFLFQFSASEFLECLRFTLALVYLFGFINKLNIGFLSGYVIWRYSILHQITNNFGFNTYISIALALTAISVVIFEGFMAYILVRRKITETLLSIATLFHLLIIILMHEYSFVTFIELAIFNLTCILLLILSFAGSLKVGYFVIWDVNCSFCRNTISVIQKLDFLKVLTFVSNDNSKVLKELGITLEQSVIAMQVFETSSGNIYSGYFGFRRLLLVLVPFSILYPLMKNSYIEKVGIATYRKIAESRRCNI